MCWGVQESASKESYVKELVVFHIDRLLGFYRTPAVAARFFSQEQLQQLIASMPEPERPRARAALRSILQHCGDAAASTINDPDPATAIGIEGAIVGWAPFPLTLVRH